MWKQLFWRKGKRRYGLHASYTVEASYIMSIVLLSMSLLVRSAYVNCRQETGIMRLHHMVEWMRGQEENQASEISSAAWQGKVKRNGAKVEGDVHGVGWQKEISAEAHEPENMMRMLTVFDGLSGGKGE